MRNRWLTELTSIPRIVISFLLQPPPPPPPPPPLLPAVAVDRHHMMQNLHNLQLGMPAFILATTTPLALLFSDKFSTSEAHYFVILGFMGAAALLWNGILFLKMNLQLLGIILCLLSLYALVASVLPLAFSSASCLLGAVCLCPLLYFLIKPQPAAA